MTRADAMGMLLAFVARLVTGAQGHWKGCPPKAEQRIYFANHQSHLDWVLIWAALPKELRAGTRPIAARDYWTSSRFKHWITREVFNAVYVSRTRSDDQDPLEPLVEALRNGDSLVIFPEGTRSSGGLPKPFKSGLYSLAQQFPDVQLIPAWIDNVQRVMPKGEVVPVPILCTVTFGAPISLRPDEERRAFLDRARDAVVALQPGGSAVGGGANSRPGSGPHSGPHSGPKSDTNSGPSTGPDSSANSRADGIPNPGPNTGDQPLAAP